MNIPALNPGELEKAEKIFDAENAKKTAAVKELKPQLDSNNKRRAQIAKELDVLYAEQRSINLELAKLPMLKTRPWSVFQVVGNIIAIVPNAVSFDRGKVTKKQIKELRLQREARSDDLNDEMVVLRSKIEPLEEEQRELNIDHQSLVARLESNRPLDWLSFQLSFVRNEMISAGR